MKVATFVISETEQKYLLVALHDLYDSIKNVPTRDHTKQKELKLIDKLGEKIAKSNFMEIKED